MRYYAFDEPQTALAREKDDISEAPDNVVQLVPAGKIRCYVSGALRADRPEEHVRQRWARSLVTEYGYARDDMRVEFRIKMGSAAKRADLVIFKPGAPKTQENVLIVIEVKREGVLPKDRSEGVAQLKSYMAACSSCRYGLWVGAEKSAHARLVDGSIVDTVDIPRAGDDSPRVPEFADLVPAVDLKATLRRCHNYIYANQGLQKAEAFHELVKLIFAKVYDETESDGPLRFYVQADERRSAAGQRRLKDDRIVPLFEAVRERYDYIFPASDELTLNGRVLAYIVSELQSYSLLRTQTDVKGSAYEELVGANLRGDRGEYFTPRNVCDMAVRMVFALYPRRKLTSLRILDTCCGTGGFLVSVINYLRHILTLKERAKGGDEAEIVARVNAQIREIAGANLFGLDINPFLVRTCQMNLVMHGDGSANLFQADSLYSPGEWENSEAAARVAHGKFDVVVTNPPFGGKAVVDDPHLLDQYELTGVDRRDPRSSLPAEQLFVEGAWKYLKPGGHLAIVLPDSILNNPSLDFIRHWLFGRARVVASVDLPKETFADSGGVPNPSVLIVQRLTREEVKLASADALVPNDIFMAIPKTAGRNKRGDAIYCKNPEGLEILDDNLEPELDDELPLVADGFESWLEGAGAV
jgi:type I restriction enzyme M protein